MTDFKNARLMSCLWWMGVPLIVLLGTQPVFGQPITAGPRGPVAAAASQDLAQAPELIFEEAFARTIHANAARARISDAIGAANRLNKKSLDGFVEEINRSRPHLRGLPFLMGKDCRMPDERFRSFADAGESAHHAISVVRSREWWTGKPVAKAGDLMTEAFEEAYFAAARKSAGLPDPHGLTTQLAIPGLALPFYKLQQSLARQQAVPESMQSPVAAAAQVAALMQILAPESADLHVGLANYLARVPHAEAARALARLAIFSEEAEVRQAACKALQLRDGRDYAEILVRGLAYPLPAVAERASEAVSRLKRTELIPNLVSTLEQPDPRAPSSKEIEGKRVFEVREVVRINHHRNCLLCHAPGNTADVPKHAIKAAIAVPGERLPSHQGYGDLPPNPEHVVRIDITYLRQDFSRRLPVADSAPWPTMQRFDFLVRTRTVTAKEAEDCQKRLEAKSPYHRAADLALREMTGRDAPASTAEAWRRVLGTR